MRLRGSRVVGLGEGTTYWGLRSEPEGGSVDRLVEALAARAGLGTAHQRLQYGDGQAT